MERIDFIKKLYNGKNCYSDFMTRDELEFLRIQSKIDDLIEKWIYDNKIIFLTGNPGDGKTFIIKTHTDSIEKYNVFVETDINSLNDEELSEFAININDCYVNNRPCIIAANEFPFLSLQKKIKKINKDFYEDLVGCKKHNIIYGNDFYSLKRCVVVDLNERNMLDSQNNGLFADLLKKTSEYLLEEHLQNGSTLKINIKHLSDAYVQSKITHLVNLVACNGKHFVVRDILGFVSYLFVSSEINEDKTFYYDSIFENNSDNLVLKEMAKFDPIKVTNPSIDEQLWNGLIAKGWELGKPSQWPYQVSNVQDALVLFKSIKRRYFFENVNASIENFIDPIYNTILDMLKHPERRGNIEKIILSINNMYSNKETENEKLYIWTTNRYDLSIDFRAAVCSKSIYKDKFELLIPETDKWLQGYEFVPSYLVFRLKNYPDISLKLDIDLLTILLKVSDGYPSGLLDAQYEQLLNSFMRRLENSDDCTIESVLILTNRRNNEKLEISIDEIDNTIKFVR